MVTWRRTLYAMWVAQLLAIFGFSLRIPFLPLFLEDLGTETFEQQALWAGFITAAGAAVMAIAAPIWGVFADRYGRRIMVLRSMFAASLAVGLMALATSPWHLLGLRFFEGAMTGTVAAATTLIATTVPRERMGYAMGLMQMAVFSGSSIGPLLGGLLADFIGFRATFVVAGSLLFTAGVVVLLFVTENFTRPEPRPVDDKAPGVSTWSILAGGAMLAMLLVMLVSRTGQSAIQPLAPLFMNRLDETVSAASYSGIALGTMGVTSAISSVFFGRLADRIGQRSILILSMSLAGAFYFPQAAAQTPMQYIIAMGLFGTAVGGIMPTAASIVANLTPQERRGVIYGFTNTAMSIGMFIGPLGGTVLAAYFSIRVSFVALGFLTLTAAFWAWYAIPASIDLRRSSPQSKPR